MRNMSMKTNAIRRASGVALFAFAAPFPAYGQFMSNCPIIIVPPPAQEYVQPKPAPRSPPERSKPPDTPAQAAPAQGGTMRGGGTCPIRLASSAQRIGGAYWMPPLFQSSLNPRGMPSFELAPTLRSNTSP